MKDKRILMGTALVLLLLLTTGLSYAYFSTSVKGNDNAKDVVVEAGTLKLTYTDGPAINVQNIKPGWTTTKTVSVKNNGTLDTAYNIVWQELTNTILKNELALSATCKRLNASGTVEGTCEPITELPVRAKRIAQNISIESGFTHEYTFTFLFKETNTNQNYNQGKEFNGVLGIEEYKDTAVYCTYDGELTQGVEYTNGQYTYRYMQEKTDANVSNGTVNWKNMDEDGWGVALTNPLSTEDIDTKEVCTYINDKPVSSMGGMFALSQSQNIDLSSLNTSKVTNMIGMFGYTQALKLDLSNFDTSNVTNMNSMFVGSHATTLDVSSFDTSNVTSMEVMFDGSQVTVLDLSSFDTSNVTNMSNMFEESHVTILDLSGFDTSNVTDMSYMFNGSQATTLDVSGFDTSNVTNMNGMFNNSQATTLDVSKFDTSNVTNMSSMFNSSKATTLDVSNFDTSKVTDMGYMFAGATNLKTIYVSNKFDVSKVTDSTSMFLGCTNLVGGAGTKYNSTKVDKTYARIDGGEASPGYFTAK